MHFSPGIVCNPVWLGACSADHASMYAPLMGAQHISHAHTIPTTILTETIVFRTVVWLKLGTDAPLGSALCPQDRTHFHYFCG